MGRFAHGTFDYFITTEDRGVFRRALHDLSANRVLHEPGNVMNVEPLHDLSAVRLDGLHAEVEAARDFFRRVTFCDQLQNLALARRFDDKVLVVPEGDFQRDLMMDLLANNPQTKTFQDEVLQAARVIARKYNTDRAHAEHVASLAQEIFRGLQDLHGLEPKHELLLRVAAILHETGMFVSSREHHKHSLYIILNTEIFGLGTHDRTLVALLARYHRRYNPDPGHPHFSDLSREDRMTIFKLAAILRIADALDRSHSQRIKKIVLRRDRDILFIETAGVEDNLVEQMAVNGKCDIVEEIYGLSVVLRGA